MSVERGASNKPRRARDGILVEEEEEEGGQQSQRRVGRLEGGEGAGQEGSKGRAAGSRAEKAR